MNGNREKKGNTTVVCNVNQKDIREEKNKEETRVTNAINP